MAATTTSDLVGVAPAGPAGPNSDAAPGTLAALTSTMTTGALADRLVGYLVAPNLIRETALLRIPLAATPFRFCSNESF